ncbi:MAG: helix-turn-helix domain-containing protein [Clostridia bacterium]|nr:helix-turn-helix domain-containing protein [Clostridia bacterium]
MNTESLNNIVFKLQRAMEKSGLSYGEIAALTGIPKSAVHRYISGETPKIPLERLEKIAQAVGSSAAEIMGWDAKTPTPKITEDYTTFPVIGEVAAGYDYPALEDWEGETVDIPNSYLRGRGYNDFFVLKVKGDSMYPAYQDGDKVLVLRQTTLNHSGQVGVVLYNDDMATLKRVEYNYGEDWMRLVPVNPAFPPIKIVNEELEHCRVLGIPKLLLREIDD